jgi:DNA-directed RNA polymerase subunit RPC12/RpoP
MYEYRCRRCKKKFHLIESIPPTGGDPECEECVAEEIMKAIFDPSGIPASKGVKELLQEVRK